MSTATAALLRELVPVAHRLPEFSVHGDDNGDVWLRHDACRSDLPRLDDPWTLELLVAGALDHIDNCRADHR